LSHSQLPFLRLISAANARLLYGRDRTYDIITYQAESYNHLNNNKDQTGDATASLVAYEPPAERNGEILLSVTVKPVDNPITIIKAVSKLADKVNSVVEVYNEQMKAGVKFQAGIIQTYG
jgi:hypothetical protein